ncbi:MAG TPA: outer membrane beta-barrel protein [Candidatus Limnocylindrales bacterium]|nr:outer membrane beta-barrel protein [Candidatus Limnocylindrales bacterium]
MVRYVRIVILATFISFISLSQLSAQELDENDHINTNLAFPVTVPVSTTSDLVKLGTGVTAGAGYNFNQHHAFVGEIMWNWLYPTDASLAPLRNALGSTALNGHSNLFAFSANYRFEMRGKRFGGYVIGGPGLYYRNADLSTSVTAPSGTPCTPVWQWWGYHCSSGIVLNETHSTFSSSVLGGNFGGGVTVKVGNEARYRMYVEARYHYVPFQNNATVRLLPITTGIRF